VLIANIRKLKQGKLSTGIKTTIVSPSVYLL